MCWHMAGIGEMLQGKRKINGSSGPCFQQSNPYFVKKGLKMLKPGISEMVMARSSMRNKSEPESSSWDNSKAVAEERAFGQGMDSD